MVDRLTITGQDADARFWIGALDIFCFPSMDEGLPNVVMEAAAAGVPVVAWRTPFLEELLVDGRSAVLVAPGNMRDMASAVEGLIQDAGRRQRIGWGGRREILANFSVTRYVDGITRAYEELLADGRPSVRLGMS